MNSGHGRRDRAGRKAASFQNINGTRRAPALNGNKAGGRAGPIGALVISPDGKSKFYPEGGREKPASVSRSARDPSPEFESKRPHGHGAPQTVYYNNPYSYDMRTERDEYDDDAMSGISDHGDRHLSLQQTSFQNLCILSGVALAVLVVVAVIIVVPIALVGSASSRPTVTGTVRLGIQFIDSFDNVGSTEYNNIVTDFTTVMNGIFEGNPTFSNIFTETKVTDLASGDDLSTTTLVSFSLLFASGTEITPLFTNNVYGFVYMQINAAGSVFAVLNVVTDSLTITESCDRYCENSGTLNVPGCTCACATGFDGGRCQNIVTP